MTREEALNQLKPIEGNLVPGTLANFLDQIEADNTTTIAWHHPSYVEPAETHESANDTYDGWIDSINLNGKKYAIKAAIVEYHALTCPKCGGQIHMHNGMGKCPFCDTEFSATIRLMEV